MDTADDWVSSDISQCEALLNSDSAPPSRWSVPNCGLGYVGLFQFEIFMVGSRSIQMFKLSYFTNGTE